MFSCVSLVGENVPCLYHPCALIPTARGLCRPCAQQYPLITCLGLLTRLAGVGADIPDVSVALVDLADKPAGTMYLTIQCTCTRGAPEDPATPSRPPVPSTPSVAAPPVAPPSPPAVVAPSSGGNRDSSMPRGPPPAARRASVVGGWSVLGCETRCGAALGLSTHGMVEVVSTEGTGGQTLPW